MLDWENIDLIIVPFPMLLELHKNDLSPSEIVAKCCTASIDRATGICSSTHFCFL